MAWNPIDVPCDYITLAQQRSPGLADIAGASSLREWDELKAHGFSGATCVFKGRPLAKFSVRLRLYTREHWEAWEAWKPLVLKVPTRRGNGADSGAMMIYHPLLEQLGIGEVAVTEVVQPEQTDHGEWTVEIKFIEFRRPKYTLAKPEGAAASTNDPVDNVISELASQYQELANE